jgi:stress response protein SCP2
MPTGTSSCVAGGAGGGAGRFDLSEDPSTDTCVVLAKVYRKNGEWRFAAVGQGSPEQAGLLADYRVPVA